jgi:hypothetical protein
MSGTHCIVTLRGSELHEAFIDAFLNHTGMVWHNGVWFELLYAVRRPDTDFFEWAARVCRSVGDA